MPVLDQTSAPIYERWSDSAACVWFPLMSPATSGAGATRS